MTCSGHHTKGGAGARLKSIATSPQITHFFLTGQKETALPQTQDQPFVYKVVRGGQKDKECTAVQSLLFESIPLLILGTCNKYLFYRLCAGAQN